MYTYLVVSDRDGSSRVCRSNVRIDERDEERYERIARTVKNRGKRDSRIQPRR